MSGVLILKSDSHVETCHKDVSLGSTTQSSESSSPLMCPSYEFISILPEYATDMILYVNPKVLEFHDGPLTSTEFFPESEMDLELEAIFNGNPPLVSGLITGTRSHLGTSVTSGLKVDIYNSTTDLEQMGNASYFSGVITPAERAAIGWNPPLSVSKWNSLRHAVSSKVVSNCTGSLKRRVLAAVPVRNVPESGRNLPEFGKSRMVTLIGRITRRFPLKPKWNFFKKILPSCANRTVDDQDLRNEERDKGDLTLKDDEKLKDAEGDRVMTSRMSSLASSSNVLLLPPIVMIPVLTRRDKIWFLGNPTPEEHKPLAGKYKIEIQRQHFSKFHHRVYQSYAENNEGVPPPN